MSAHTFPKAPSTGSTGLQLWLLGPWQAQLGAQQLAPLPTRHARALLARLALTHPRPIPRTQLQADLFPNVSPDSAARSMRTTLYYLRRALGELLQTEDESVALAPTLSIMHDVGRFEAATAPNASQAALEEAIQLYRGPFLSGPAVGWAGYEAQRLHARFVEALRRLVALAQASGTPEAALEATRRWVEEEPWEEEAHLALIAGLHACGDRATAEAQIARARTLLRAEWGEGSSPALESLARAVARLPRPAAQAEPPASSAPAPDLLPSQRAPATPAVEFERLPLIGRGQELELLSQAWARTRRERAGGILLTGAAGVGKTRLAQELAARIRLRADSLVLWGVANAQMATHTLALFGDAFTRLSGPTLERVRASCASLDDMAWSVLQRCLPELGRLLPERPALELPRLEAAAETARRRAALLAFADALTSSASLLLVLEHVHLADPDTLALACELASGKRRVLVLLSSRPGFEPPDQAFTSLPLGPLDQPSAEALLQAALGPLASATLITQLAQRSGGNPLFARELVRALVADGRLRQAEGEARPSLLDQLGLPGPVVDLLDQRLALLSPLAQELARLLALLGRPAEEALLHQLLPEEEPRLAVQAELLEQWVLVQRGDRLRFDHDWLRERLIAALDEPARAGLHVRIAAALEALPAADPAERMWHYANSGQWPAALRDALAAASHALEESNLPALGRAVQLAGRAAAILELSPTDQRRWALLLLRESYDAQAERGAAWSRDLDELMQLAQASDNPSWGVEARIRRGRALREQGQLPEAERVLREAIALAQRAGLRQAEADVRGLLASVIEDRGASEQALAQARAAAAAAEASGDQQRYVRALMTLGYMQMSAGQEQEAHRLLLPLLEHPIIQQQPWLAARFARQLGIIKLAVGDYEPAFELMRESVRRAQAIGDLQSMLICQASLLYELTRFGLYEEGRPLGEATLELARHLGARRQLGAVLYSLALTYLSTGDAQRAWSEVQESIRVGQALGVPGFIAASLEVAATIALSLGWLHEAQAAVERAAQLPDISGPVAAGSAQIAARVWLALGQAERARTAAHAAIRQAAESGLDAVFAIKTLWNAASVLASVEGSAVARPVQERAYSRFLDTLARFSSPAVRRAFIAADPAHAALAQFQSGPRRLVLLPLDAAPLGRPLHADELVPVVWTLRTAADPESAVPRRQHQLRRLVAEALQQGASATVEALADVLAVSPRTILRDLETLREQGIVIETRGSSQRRSALAT